MLSSEVCNASVLVQGTIEGSYVVVLIKKTKKPRTARISLQSKAILASPTPNCINLETKPTTSTLSSLLAEKYQKVLHVTFKCSATIVRMNLERFRFHL